MLPSDFRVMRDRAPELLLERYMATQPAFVKFNVGGVGLVIHFVRRAARSLCKLAEVV